MKKQNAKKLDLSRETLLPLQPEALDGVAGGASPASVTTTTVITRLVCPSFPITCVAK